MKLKDQSYQLQQSSYMGVKPLCMSYLTNLLRFSLTIKSINGYGLVYDALELYMPQFKNIIKKDLMVCSSKAACIYTELNSTIWNIEGIYRNKNTYVFVSGNRILKIYFPITPTDDQIQHVIASINRADWFQEHKKS